MGLQVFHSQLDEGPLSLDRARESGQSANGQVPADLQRAPTRSLGEQIVLPES